MTLVLVATPGATDANTYATVAEADAYFAGRLPATSWDNADQADKERALVTATRRLDLEGEPPGTARWDTQALVWPRRGVFDENGWERDAATIPAPLVAATCELAYAMLADPTVDYFAPVDTAGLRALQAGSLSLQFAPQNTYDLRPLPQPVLLALAKLYGGASNRLLL